MAKTRREADTLTEAQRERNEIMLLLAMIDESLTAHRGVDEIERRLLLAREVVHKRLVDLNTRIERAGGTRPRGRRFGRGD